MNRLERIEKMEERMDRLTAAVRHAEEALEQWKDAQGALQELTAYYTSPLWLQDYEADERGEIPKSIKRGVLSQDGVYDLLRRIKDMQEEFQALCQKEEESPV